MLKQWSDEYLTGIDQIDEQHKQFFDASHNLYDKIINCEGEEAIEEMVGFLRGYAEVHFKTEEAFMCEHGFPRVLEHRQLHLGFFESLDQLVEDLKVFGPTQHLADRALEIAQDWLLDHIAEEDAQYATHVKKQGP